MSNNHSGVGSNLPGDRVPALSRCRRPSLRTDHDGRLLETCACGQRYVAASKRRAASDSFASAEEVWSRAARALSAP